MADFNKGQTFFDECAVNYEGTKGKYYIALSDADNDDDLIVCFVMNTENRMDKYHLLCNKDKQRFIISPGTFTFIKRYTSIMLMREVFYKYSEIYQDNIKLLDLTDDNLVRQIKNCIDWNYISEKAKNIIKQSFKYG